MPWILALGTYACVYCGRPVNLFRWQNKRINISIPRGSDFARDDGQTFAAFHGRCERQERRWMAMLDRDGD